MEDFRPISTDFRQERQVLIMPEPVNQVQTSITPQKLSFRGDSSHFETSFRKKVDDFLVQIGNFYPIWELSSPN